MIKTKLSSIPEKSGVYQYLNKEGKIIYIGKAKNLKKRINQYFTKSNNYRIAKMVSEIFDVNITITNNETEALIMEQNLIKQKSPKYNVLLKDSKRYPYIFVSDEKDPQIVVTRTRRKKGKYFGPYPDGSKARDIVQILNRIFPLRKCKTLPKEPCLYYSIKQCLGPCIKEISQVQYQNIVQDISDFLNGDKKEIILNLKEKMNAASEALNFEKASDYKKIIEKISFFSEKQNVEIKDNTSRDVIGYYNNDNHIMIVQILIRNGRIIDIINSFYPILNEIDNVIETHLFQWYQDVEQPKELVSDKSVDLSNLAAVLDIKYRSLEKGQNYEIITMANNTAKTEYELKKISELKKLETHQKAMSILSKLSNVEINSIELYDVSHTGGEDTIGAMVRFENGVYIKNKSRKFNIQSSTNDDYGSMREMLYRRYSNLEKEEYPDCIIMDGGVGQVNTCLSVLDILKIQIPVFGLAKDGKHKTNVLIFDSQKIEFTSREVQNYFANMQERIHKFAISSHRFKQRKSMFNSYLDNIQGVGKVAKTKIMESYPTLESFKSASKKELLKIVPEKIVNNITEYLKEKDE